LIVLLSATATAEAGGDDGNETVGEGMMTGMSQSCFQNRVWAHPTRGTKIKIKNKKPFKDGVEMGVGKKKSF
jgi:hypothetical protein